VITLSASLTASRILHAHDDTFKEAGIIGLWAKVDASSAFDDAMVYDPPSGKTTENTEE